MQYSSRHSSPKTSSSPIHTLSPLFCLQSMARPSLSCSLLFACLLVLLASPNPSAALSHVGNPNAPRHIQHAQIIDSKKRMVKVRQIFGNHGGTNAAAVDTNGDNTGNDPAKGSVSASSTTTTSAAASTTTTTTATPSVVSTTTTTTTSALPSTTSAAISTTTTTTTTTTPPASSPPASATLNLVPQSSSTPASSAAAASRTVSVATAQVTVDLPTESAASDNTTTSANTFGRNTIIAIAVIASCVGGAAAIWTLIRKWKLGPSAKFEERMAPIEWSPDMGSTAGTGIPGADREKTYGATEKHSRSGSHGSFHSSDAEHNNVGRNVTGNGNMFADQHPAAYGTEAHDFTAGPVHDFTAGPAHYPPAGYDAYGNPAAGYVDLQRTTSNGSNHSDKAGLQRGPSMAHATAAPAAPAPANYAYDNGYGNAAYAHDAYGQDAYAGYDAYGQHYPAQQGQYGAQQGQYGARY